MEKTLSDKKAILVFVLPGLLFFCIVILAPIFQSLYYSLLDWNGINQAAFVGLKNYIDMFTVRGHEFFPALWHSLLLAIFSVFIQLPISLVLALILVMGIKGEKAYRTIYFIPVIISTAIIGQLWMKMYHPTYGIVNVFLKTLGLGEFAREWLGDPKTALVAVFIPMIWQYIGYHMLLMYTAAKSISTDVYEAARVDGAGNFTIATRITLPQILPMIKTCTIFAVIGSLKSFDLIYVLTKGGPMNATEVPSTWMYNNIFTRYSYGFGSSVAVFIILECLLLTVIIQNVFPKEQV